MARPKLFNEPIAPKTFTLPARLIRTLKKKAALNKTSANRIAVAAFELYFKGEI